MDHRDLASDKNDVGLEPDFADVSVLTPLEFLKARLVEDQSEALRRFALVGDKHIRDLREVSAKRAIVALHEDWPVLIEAPPVFGIDPALGVDDIAFTMIQRMKWTTQREFIKTFGTEPPTAPMIMALVSIYIDHEDYDPSWGTYR